MTCPDRRTVRIRRLGLCPYRETLRRMQAFTATRDAATPDEIWLLEHPPVYTLGQAGRREHLLSPADIEVVETDRGGQVTYHGPGQLVVYTLIDLTRRGLGVRETVWMLEESVIVTLADLGIVADRRAGAPGVYVGGEKIAALGLRVRRGRCYHGLALNIDPDLEPFSRIDPCGYPGLAVTSVSRHQHEARFPDIAAALLTRLLALLRVPADQVEEGERGWPMNSALAT